MIYLRIDNDHRIAKRVPVACHFLNFSEPKNIILMMIGWGKEMMGVSVEMH